MERGGIEVAPFQWTVFGFAGDVFTRVTAALLHLPWWVGSPVLNAPPIGQRAGAEGL